MLHDRRRHCEYHNRYDKRMKHYKRDLRNFKRAAIRIRIFALLMIIILSLVMFKYRGIDAITIFLAGIFIIHEVMNIYVFWKFKRKIVNPIQKLKEGVDNIANGNYSFRISEDYRNEIGMLIREFNNMAEKLEESEKIKRDYEKNRKALIANISHDLKTPITSINGYAQFMLDGDLDKDKMRKYLKTVQSNADYMNKLIDDLFLFTKLDMDKFELNFEDINIKMYMQDIVEEFSFILEEENIKFNYFNTIKDDIYVNIDSKMIHRCIRNILGNAVKYGGVEENLKIEINLYNKEEDVYISIKDNGPGIEKEKLCHIFERFYRIDKERTKDLMSTGLGLAIAKEIVDAHNGDISVESELGLGSTFIIKIPMQEKGA